LAELANGFNLQTAFILSDRIKAWVAVSVVISLACDEVTATVDFAMDSAAKEPQRGFTKEV
jgi:hypothetical protein